MKAIAIRKMMKSAGETPGLRRSVSKSRIGDLAQGITDSAVRGEIENAIDDFFRDASTIQELFSYIETTRSQLDSEEDISIVDKIISHIANSLVNLDQSYRSLLLTGAVGGTVKSLRPRRKFSSDLEEIAQAIQDPEVRDLVYQEIVVYNRGDSSIEESVANLESFYELSSAEADAAVIDELIALISSGSKSLKQGGGNTTVYVYDVEETVLTPLVYDFDGTIADADNNGTWVQFPTLQDADAFAKEMQKFGYTVERSLKAPMDAMLSSGGIVGKRVEGGVAVFHNLTDNETGYYIEAANKIPSYEGYDYAEPEQMLTLWFGDKAEADTFTEEMGGTPGLNSLRGATTKAADPIAVREFTLALQNLEGEGYEIPWLKEAIEDEDWEEAIRLLRAADSEIDQVNVNTLINEMIFGMEAANIKSLRGARQKAADPIAVQEFLNQEANLAGEGADIPYLKEAIEDEDWEEAVRLLEDANMRTDDTNLVTLIGEMLTDIKGAMINLSLRGARQKVAATTYPQDGEYYVEVTGVSEEDAEELSKWARQNTPTYSHGAWYSNDSANYWFENADEAEEFRYAAEYGTAQNFSFKPTTKQIDESSIESMVASILDMIYEIQDPNEMPSAERIEGIEDDYHNGYRTFAEARFHILNIAAELGYIKSFRSRQKQISGWAVIVYDSDNDTDQAAKMYTDLIETNDAGGGNTTEYVFSSEISAQDFRAAMDEEGHDVEGPRDISEGSQSLSLKAAYGVSSDIDTPDVQNILFLIDSISEMNVDDTTHGILGEISEAVTSGDIASAVNAAEHLAQSLGSDPNIGNSIWELVSLLDTIKSLRPRQKGEDWANEGLTYEVEIPPTSNFDESYATDVALVYESFYGSFPRGENIVFEFGNLTDAEAFALFVGEPVSYKSLKAAYGVSSGIDTPDVQNILFLIDSISEMNVDDTTHGILGEISEAVASGNIGAAVNAAEHLAQSLGSDPNIGESIWELVSLLDTIKSLRPRRKYGTTYGGQFVVTISTPGTGEVLTAEQTAASFDSFDISEASADLTTVDFFFSNEDDALAFEDKMGSDVVIASSSQTIKKGSYQRLIADLIGTMEMLGYKEDAEGVKQNARDPDMLAAFFEEHGPWDSKLITDLIEEWYISLVGERSSSQTIQKGEDSLGLDPMANVQVDVTPDLVASYVEEARSLSSYVEDEYDEGQGTLFILFMEVSDAEQFASSVGGEVTEIKSSSQTIQKVSIQDFSLFDDGTLDTVVIMPDGEEVRYSWDASAPYRDDESGELDFDKFVEEVVMPDWKAEWKSSSQTVTKRDENVALITQAVATEFPDLLFLLDADWTPEQLDSELSTFINSGEYPGLKEFLSEFFGYSF